MYISISNLLVYVYTLMITDINIITLDILFFCYRVCTYFSTVNALVTFFVPTQMRGLQQIGPRDFSCLLMAHCYLDRV